MSEENKNESQSEATSPHRGIAMVITIAIAVLLLYALSIGPAAVVATKYPKCEPALSEFYFPVGWLANHTALEKPLQIYIDSWVRI